MTYPTYTLPFQSYSSPFQYPQYGLLIPSFITSSIPSSKPTSEGTEISDIATDKPFSISLNASDDGELTGEMFVKFDIENAEQYPYPENDDYLYDINGNVWRDKKAYIHLLVRETDPKTD